MNSRGTRLRSALAVILTVLVLVPTAVLFGRVWTDVSDRKDSAQLEKQGVEYLTALAPLVSALAESQSTAIQGVAEPPDSLAAAVSRVSAVDARLGDSLKTKERWTGLQQQIGKLPKITGVTNIYNAHVEATDLALELYIAVRRNSELNRDPDSDMANLQQAVAVDMPETVVRVNRMGDLANILQGVSGATRSELQLQFGQEVIAAEEAVDELTDDLQAAVDDTESQTLSGSLVTSLDSFRRGVESMTRGANPRGAPNVATITTAQSTLQTALSNLAGITLKEMERLLDDRIDGLNYRRNEAVVMGLLALLLVLGAVLWPVLGRRGAEPAAAADAPVESTRDVARDRPAGGSPYGAGPYDQASFYGDGNTTRRERSGAVR